LGTDYGGVHRRRMGLWWRGDGVVLKLWVMRTDGSRCNAAHCVT
jgi:hypothetical protein